MRLGSGSQRRLSASVKMSRGQRGSAYLLAVGIEQPATTLRPGRLVSASGVENMRTGAPDYADDIALCATSLTDQHEPGIGTVTRKDASGH